MISYFFTDKEGKILSFGSCLNEDEIYNPDNKEVYLVEYQPGATHYINGVFETKQDLSVIEAQARQQRMYLLIDSDKTQLPDYPTNLKEEWVVYRQQLRDVTNQLGWPTDIIWPIKPE